ncbi:CDP-alcohol phosphatidyltransferase family protein [Streptomyces sp. NPDC006879]|uniref:CDP-alcohol phosphatidyltransferase family protein n=1 Tax=Streptomyces sp. NPDC006879 TaxID=3364767 RepID=UPI0036878AAD
MSELTDSRAATDALLGTLRDEGGLTPERLRRLLWLAGHRSVRQAATRPRAVLQVSAVHGLLAALATRRRPGPRWVATAWALSLLHLGLLERRRAIAAADVLTLIRGALPATALGASRWSGAVAVTLDVIDGHLARRRCATSPFGAYADSLADAAFWTWMALNYEPNRTLRAVAVGVWCGPVVVVTALAVRRGAMPRGLRPVVLRPAAAMQILLALRRLRRPPASVPRRR